MGQKKGYKISTVKRGNHLRQKVATRGKLKRNKRKALKMKHQQIQNPEEEVNKEEEHNVVNDMMEMMDVDDVAFLKNAEASHSYHILKKIRKPDKSMRTKRGQEMKDSEENNEELERLYESHVLDRPDLKRTKLLLPIKTKDGVIMRSAEVDDEMEEMKELERGLREAQIAREKKEKKKRKKNKGERKEENEEVKKEDDYQVEMFQDPSEQVVPLSTVDLLALREELIHKKKFQIGMLAASLLENPEGKIRNFKLLQHILSTEHSQVKLTVRKLAALSLLEVFRDLLPAYPIKHQETRPGFKQKKKTLELNNYEKSLLRAYKMYLQSLEKMAKVLHRKPGDHTPYNPNRERLGLVGVRCMSDLLVNHPYFNFAPNIAQAVVHFLNNKNPTAREIAAKGIRTLFKEDKRGDLSLLIVRSINQFVRKRENAVRPEVLSVLMALRLRDINLDAEKEAELKEKQLKNRKSKILNMSRRDHKRQKRLEEVEREMLETKAQENKQKKQKNLTEITKLIFTIFFRVLKCAPSSKLLSVTLEGLAKFAHCINIEFFQDIVNVLDRLLLEKNLGLKEQLLCVETVFAIISGQGETLNIDPMRFYSHLYRDLMEVHGGCTNPLALIALQTLEKALMARCRKISLQRLLAFVKRLSNVAPHVMHGAALGFLDVVRNILLRMRACEVLVETDSLYGEGIYQPELPEPDYSGAGTSVLWELLLLKRHYHPEVQRMAECIVKGQEYTLPAEISKLSPFQLAETYDCSQMVFRPAVKPPRKSAPHACKGHLTLTNDEFAAYLQNVEDSIKYESLQDWEIPEDKTSERIFTQGQIEQ